MKHKTKMKITYHHSVILMVLTSIFLVSCNAVDRIPENLIEMEMISTTTDGAAWELELKWEERSYYPSTDMMEGSAYDLRGKLLGFAWDEEQQYKYLIYSHSEYPPEEYVIVRYDVPMSSDDVFKAE
jgi:hypothetical protein